MTNVVAQNKAALSKLPVFYPQSQDVDFSEAYLTQRFMRLAKAPEKISYEFTEDAGYLHQYFRMREDMFISVWGLKQFSGQKDAFDDTSHVMVARKGLQVIAGGRLTVSSPAARQALPMEGADLDLQKIFSELDLANRSYGEFSRLAILPEFRGGAVFPEIARRFIRKAIAEGVEYAFNIAPQPLARSYRQAVQLFGVKWDIRQDIEIPDREEYEGIRMVLSVMDLTRYSRDKRVVGGMAKAEKREEALAD